MALRRAMIAGILVGAFFQCVAWLLMSGALWYFQNGLVGPNTPQEVAQAQEAAVAMLAAGVLNVIALSAFANRGRRNGLWLLAVVLVADLASSLVVISLSPTLDDYFKTVSAAAALTLLLLAAFWWVSRPSWTGRAVTRSL